jgi:hypothetical protein
MECLKMNEERPSPEIEKRSVASVSTAEEVDQDSSAPVVAEFLLALAQSAPSPATSKQSTSNGEPKMPVADGDGSKGAQSARKPFVVHPLPEALTQTRIPPLVFANNLTRDMDDTSLEDYFPDQFDTEFAGYQPSDFDIICGRGRGNFSHTGNQKLLDIIRERQDDYLRSNKRGKGALGKQILIEILMNGGRFVKLIDKKTQVWSVLPYKDVNTKIMHCIRDQINFQRKQGLQKEKPTASMNTATDEPRSKKARLDVGIDTASLPPAKRLKGAKKLSNYLKFKYQNDDDTDHPLVEAAATLSREGVARAGPEDAPGASTLMRLSSQVNGINGSAKVSASEASARMRAASLLQGRNQPLRMEAPAAPHQAPSGETAGNSQRGVLPGSFSGTFTANDQQEAMKLLGQFSDADERSSANAIHPSLQDLAAQRALLLSEHSMAARARGLNFPLLQQLGTPASQLDLNRRIMLARAGVGASGFGTQSSGFGATSSGFAAPSSGFGTSSSGFGTPFSQSLRRPASGLPPTTDAIVADHIRQYAFQQDSLMNRLSSLLGNVPPRAPVLSTEIDSGITVSEGSSAAKTK